MFRHKTGALAVALFISASTMAAAAAENRWTATGAGDDIIIANCAECAEDIGMLIACRGPDQPALLSVPWQAQETPPFGPQAQLIFTIDGVSFEYTPRTKLWGMIGHVPQIDLKPADPLVGALQTGLSVAVTYGGDAVDIPLEGSSEAFSAFDENCRWADAAAGLQPAGEAQAPGNPEAQWFASSYQDEENGRKVETLTFGIPETDAFAVSATCESDRPGPAVTVLFAVDPGALPDGADIVLHVSMPGYTTGFAGQASLEHSEYSGVLVDIPVDDAFWTQLAGTGDLTFAPEGGDAGTIPLAGASGVVEAFQDACRRVFATYGGSVNPQIQGPFTYACEDGSDLIASFDASRSDPVAFITRNGRSETLIRVESDSGSHFANETTQLQTNGDGAVVITGETKVDCRQRQVP